MAVWVVAEVETVLVLPSTDTAYNINMGVTSLKNIITTETTQLYHDHGNHNPSNLDVTQSLNHKTTMNAERQHHIWSANVRMHKAAARPAPWFQLVMSLIDKCLL
jgi:hypothetical protein